MSFSKNRQDQDGQGENWTWDKELNRRADLDLKQLSGVSVDAFHHVPFGPMIHDIISKDRVVEVKSYHEEYTLGGKNVNCFWFAKVLTVYGYMVKIRFLGFSPEDEEEKFEQIERFVHLKDLFRVGYCSQNQIPMVPPITVDNINDVTKQSMDSLVGNMTLFMLRDEVFDLHVKSKYKIGNKVEVQDRANLGQMRLAYIVKITAKRIQVTYWDSVRVKNKDLRCFWVHEMSEEIKPCGFSKTVGVPIHAPEHYDQDIIRNFGPIADSKVLGITKLLKTDMVFEVINPIKSNEITAAKVVKVLKFGYFTCKLLCENPPNEENPNTPELLFFNILSPKIFPCNFCETHGITLTPPVDADEKEPTKNFDWEVYCLKNGYTPLPINDLLEYKQVPHHKFKVNSKLEAVDMNAPESICPCTIRQIVHPFLVKVGFLGWGKDYDQWKPINSTEMYPIGFCQLVGLPFEAPLNWNEVGITEEDEIADEDEDMLPEIEENHIDVEETLLHTDDYINHEIDHVDDPSPPNSKSKSKSVVITRKLKTPLVKTTKVPIEIKVKTTRPAKIPTTKTTAKQQSSSKVQDIPAPTPDAIEDTDVDVLTVRRSTRKSKRPNCFGENIALKLDSDSLDL